MREQPTVPSVKAKKALFEAKSNEEKSALQKKPTISAKSRAASSPAGSTEMLSSNSRQNLVERLPAMVKTQSLAEASSNNSMRVDGGDVNNNISVNSAGQGNSNGGSGNNITAPASSSASFKDVGSILASSRGSIVTESMMSDFTSRRKKEIDPSELALNQKLQSFEQKITILSKQATSTTNGNNLNGGSNNSTSARTTPTPTLSRGGNTIYKRAASPSVSKSNNSLSNSLSMQKLAQFVNSNSDMNLSKSADVLVERNEVGTDNLTSRPISCEPSDITATNVVAANAAIVVETMNQTVAPPLGTKSASSDLLGNATSADPSRKESPLVQLKRAFTINKSSSSSTQPKQQITINHLTDIKQLQAKFSNNDQQSSTPSSTQAQHHSTSSLTSSFSYSEFPKPIPNNVRPVATSSRPLPTSPQVLRSRKSTMTGETGSQSMDQLFPSKLSEEFNHVESFRSSSPRSRKSTMSAGDGVVNSSMDSLVSSPLRMNNNEEVAIGRVSSSPKVLNSPIVNRIRKLTRSEDNLKAQETANELFASIAANATASVATESTNIDVKATLATTTVAESAVTYALPPPAPVLEMKKKQSSPPLHQQQYPSQQELHEIVSSPTHLDEFIRTSVETSISGEEHANSKVATLQTNTESSMQQQPVITTTMETSKPLEEPEWVEETVAATCAAASIVAVIETVVTNSAADFQNVATLPEAPLYLRQESFNKTNSFVGTLTNQHAELLKAFQREMATKPPTIDAIPNSSISNLLATEAIALPLEVSNMAVLCRTVDKTCLIASLLNSIWMVCFASQCQRDRPSLPYR